MKGECNPVYKMCQNKIYTQQIIDDGDDYCSDHNRNGLEGLQYEKKDLHDSCDGYTHLCIYVFPNNGFFAHMSIRSHAPNKARRTKPLTHLHKCKNYDTEAILFKHVY